MQPGEGRRVVSTTWRRWGPVIVLSLVVVTTHIGGLAWLYSTLTARVPPAPVERQAATGELTGEESQYLMSRELESYMDELAGELGLEVAMLPAPYYVWQGMEKAGNMPERHSVDSLLREFAPRHAGMEGRNYVRDCLTLHLVTMARASAETSQKERAP